MSGTEERKGWYPGKFVGRAMDRRKNSSGTDRSSVSGSTSQLRSSSIDETTPVSASNSHMGSTEDWSLTGLSTSVNDEGIPVREAIAGAVRENQKSTHVPSSNTTPVHFHQSVAQMNISESIGRLQLTIHELRYVSVPHTTTLTATVNGQKSVVNLPSNLVQMGRTTSTPLPEKAYEVYEISTNLRIELRSLSPNSSGGILRGQIAIPISSLLTPLGKSRGEVSSWYEFLPSVDHRRLQLDALSRTVPCTSITDLPSPYRFVAALPDVPGSAMTRGASSIGFARMTISFTPTPSLCTRGPLFYLASVYSRPCLALKPWNRGRAASIVVVQSSSGDSRASLDYTDQGIQIMSRAIVQRDLERLRALFGLPAALVPFLGFPEVFALIAVVGFLLSTVTARGFPIVVVLLLFLNGLSARSARQLEHSAIWNEPGSSLPAVKQSTASSITNASTAALSLLESYITADECLALQLHQAVHHLEVLSGIFSFADDHVSVPAYILLFAIALLASFWTSLFGGRSLIFLIVATGLLMLSLLEISYGPIGLDPVANSKLQKSVSFVHRLSAHFSALLTRIPDALEIQHRLIAATSAVKEGGGEMFDAKADFDALTTSSKDGATTAPVSSSPSPAVVTPSSTPAKEAN